MGNERIESEQVLDTFTPVRCLKLVAAMRSRARIFSGSIVASFHHTMYLS